METTERQARILLVGCSHSHARRRYRGSRPRHRPCHGRLEVFVRVGSVASDVECVMTKSRNSSAYVLSRRHRRETLRALLCANDFSLPEFIQDPHNALRASNYGRCVSTRSTYAPALTSREDLRRIFCEQRNTSSRPRGARATTTRSYLFKLALPPFRRSSSLKQPFPCSSPLPACLLAPLHQSTTRRTIVTCPSQPPSTRSRTPSSG
jgi:hypothetical protein